LARFDTYFEGYQAVIFDNSPEFQNFTAALRLHQVSFRTKIRKGKKRTGRPRALVVMLVNAHGA
jgi:hypothetical protein